MPQPSRAGTYSAVCSVIVVVVLVFMMSPFSNQCDVTLPPLLDVHLFWILFVRTSRETPFLCAPRSPVSLLFTTQVTLNWWAFVSVEVDVLVLCIEVNV